jgi:hypothetical protein
MHNNVSIIKLHVLTALSLRTAHRGREVVDMLEDFPAPGYKLFEMPRLLINTIRILEGQGVDPARQFLQVLIKNI